ncbi:peptidoglycan DD-metalloendopeptidase family protein [uncultured Enterococcus sp.]|uniref:murein hydrolase activator EnvC family protein n=1 Tax=uncultured Enterococcus sp. TaxID=167972 RepID=UPI002AA6EEA5|nr:peptidoglycan DD-metalloendopeptidase family protein [uncultured Enterococcus sp.]
MKKKLILTLSFVLLLGSTPVVALAETIDEKIEAQNQKINEIISTQEEAQVYKSELEAEISELEEEYNTVLSEKQTVEQEINDLTTEIATLETKIEKRNEQLDAQARATQTGQDTSILSVMLNATSISDAISKILAVNTIVSANNEIIEAQQADKQELNTLKDSLIEQATVLEEKTAALAEQEEQLAQAKLDQDVKLNELAASLAEETAEKEQFEQQKAEAERKRQEELKAIEERKQKMAEAQALAEKEEKERLAQEAAAAEAAKEEVAEAEATPTETTDVEADTEDTVSVPESSIPTPETPADTSSGWGLPVSNVIVTSGYGYREDPTGISGNFHNGIDFGGSSSTVIMAVKSGTVVEASYDGMSGNYVIINHGDGYYSLYAHLSSATVSAGQTVGKGQQIGFMGTTGNSTGVHLHFGISTGLWSGFVNPAPLLGI